MNGLPAWLAGVLQARLNHVSRAALRANAQRLSESYRGGGGSNVIRCEADALAYAVVRMPATYAAVRAALTQAAEIVPDFAPRSLLDIGAGPGTATWAALDAWPSLRQAALIDSNPHLLALAAAFGGSPATPDVALSSTRSGLAAALGEARPTDVVMASYVLNELAAGTLIGTLDRLWSLTRSLLVIVEPGTPDGSARILACRNALLAQGATIVAPCSHDGRCPLTTGDRWCHFRARLPRSRDHLATKDASVPFEDEKFCYLVAGKSFADVARGRRVLATPKVDKGAVTFTLCAPDIADQRRIARGDKEAYRAAKRLAWGDLLRP
jgi:ribosomal protein RSM22 (predicted rRNA methylase)